MQAFTMGCNILACIRDPTCICLLGSVIKYLTRNSGVLDSRRTGSSGFVGVSLGKTLQSPSLVLVKPRKDMNNVICRRDMTEILLKAALNSTQSIK